MGTDPLESLCTSFSPDVFGRLKCMQCMDTGYMSGTLRLGRILPMYNPMPLPTKPVKSIAATHVCSGYF